MLNWNLGNSTPAEHVLNLLAQLAPSNPPAIVQDTDRVETLLSAAGIADGSYTKQDVNLTAADAFALAFAAADSKSSLGPSTTAGQCYSPTRPASSAPTTASEPPLLLPTT